MSFIWLELALSTKAKSPWLTGHMLDLCYVLTCFLPVVKRTGSPIHRLYHSLEIKIL